MKRYGNLFDPMTSFENMAKAARKALRGKKDKRAVAKFFFGLENEVITLQSELVTGTYRPQPYCQFEIREPKVRQICSSSFRDRVVHHSICNLLEPIFEDRLIYASYACRSGKGTHEALRKAQQLTGKFEYFLKCDIRKFFESIDHQILKNLLRQIVKDQKFLSLLDIIINHKVPGSPTGKGLPIGNLTSQHFANFYLGELDHFIKEKKGIKGYVRYMDDFLCFSNDKKFLNELLIQIREFIGSHLNLVLKEKVVKIAPVTDGVPFLGFRIYKNLIRLQRPNLVRSRQKIKRREIEYMKGLIGEKELNQSVSSMIAHISHADTVLLRRNYLRESLKMA